VTKKKLKREVKTLYLEGTLDNAITILSDLREEHGGGAIIEMESLHTYSDDETNVYCLYVLEEESDATYQKRLAREKAFKISKETKDRLQYERLKKKYGQ